MYFFFDEKMPDESCRNCGGTLIELKKCHECRQIYCWVCNDCSQKTNEQFHFDCMNNLPNTSKFTLKFDTHKFGLASIT